MSLRVAMPLLLATLHVTGSVSAQTLDDATVREEMDVINTRLAEAGIPLALEQVEFFTLGSGRPVHRLHQSGTRWVASDARRAASGTALSYIVDTNEPADLLPLPDRLTSFSGVSALETEAAIDRAMTTWDTTRCLRKVDLEKRIDPGGDLTLLFPPAALPPHLFSADIVFGGYVVTPFLTTPPDTLALSATFVFLDPATGQPTDINRDGYLDTALNEVYFAQLLLSPFGIVPWGIDVALPGIDLETVALHESGHSLEIGHFGPPPTAVMNPTYAGPRHTPAAVDRAGMCTVWASWPR